MSKKVTVIIDGKEYKAYYLPELVAKLIAIINKDKETN